MSYRDDVPFGLISAPPVPVVKGVAALNGTPINVPPAPIAPAATGVDGTNVAEGDRVTFRVDIKNDGSAANFNNYSIHGLQVWDVLPVGITCANVPAANIGPVSSDPGAPVGVCTDPGASGHPTFADSGTLSAVVWTFRTDAAGRPADAIPSGATRTLTYDMIIPSPSSIQQVYTNTAAVRSFDAYTNKAVNDVSTYFPSTNIDTTVLPGDTTGSVSQDTSNVVVNNAAFTKTLISTGLTDQNNSNLQAVNGETVTYRVRLDIPAHTSVFNGAVTDPLASSTWLRDTASVLYYPDADSATTAALPNNTTFDTTTGGLTLYPLPAPPSGAVYTNNTATTQRFDITITARIAPGADCGEQDEYGHVLPHSHAGSRRGCQPGRDRVSGGPPSLPSVGEDE